MKGATKTNARRGTVLAVQQALPAVVASVPRVDPALIAFDHLPDSSLVRLPVLTGLFACSPVTVWRRVKAGTLPKPVKLSPRVTAWRVGDLREVQRRATA